MKQRIALLLMVGIILTASAINTAESQNGYEYQTVEIKPAPGIVTITPKANTKVTVNGTVITLATSYDLSTMDPDDEGFYLEVIAEPIGVATYILTWDADDTVTYEIRGARRSAMISDGFGDISPTITPYAAEDDDDGGCSMGTSSTLGLLPLAIMALIVFFGRYINDKNPKEL